MCADAAAPAGTGHDAPARDPLGRDEWWIRELAERLEVSHNSLIYWREHGLVQARQEPGGWQRWIVWADAAELERLRAYRDRDIAADYRRRWTATSPGTNRSKGSTP